MANSTKAGEGVHNSYKEEAQKGCDVLFRCTIKGRSMLVDNIPLHMSIKIFKNPKEYDLGELKDFVKENDVTSPDTKTLEFKPIIFTSEKTKLEYYMLEVTGLGPQYKALYDKYDKVGNVYKKFFTHITIDKAIYDDVKENGLKPDEIKFSTLIIEHGANNTVHDFKKSEEFNKSDYGPKKLDLYSHADNARRKSTRTGETAHVGPNKEVRAAAPTRTEQAEHQARLDRQKSKKNPVKVYSPKERKKLARKMGVLAASESMDKGIKNTIVGLATAGAMALTPQHAIAPTKRPVAQKPPATQTAQYDSKKMLNTISAVESQHGKYTDHAPLKGKQTGESAFGKYGLTPDIIRDTIKINHDMKNRHAKAARLRGDDLRRYMEDNPGLEDTIASRHLKRLEHHFGQNPSKIGYAWLNGIRGTYQAHKQNQDIENHWHVKKIKAAYGQEK